NVMPAACRERVERIAHEVKAKSKGEIVVVTLPSLERRPIEEWGLRIGRGWRVGFAGASDDPRRNTGVIVLVAPTERRSRIELGYGAEAFISDSLAGRVLDDQMIPSFVKRKFGTGILRAVNALALEFARRFEFDLESAATQCAGRTPRR
ncbi:MAG: TPM domain-containing protein, partial [Gemmatimonadaceae bacterium]